MIDMGEIDAHLAYLRDLLRARWQIVDAAGLKARTPRSVEAHGHTNLKTLVPLEDFTVTSATRRGLHQRLSPPPGSRGV